MLKKISGQLTYANVMATVAVFIVLGGGAYALTNRDKQQVKEIARKQAAKLDKQIELTPGPKGDQGRKGDKGPKGDPGVDGTDGVDGSPDTAGQVLAKLLTVDGSASGLDADALDGLNSSSFLGSNAKAADSDKLDGLDSSAFVQAGGADFTDAGLPPRTPESGFACPSNTWADAASSGALFPVSYYRDTSGMVYMQGLADKCGTPPTPTVMFYLPNGYRPAGDEYFVAHMDGTNPYGLGQLTIGGNGAVVVPSESTSVSFSGVFFRCAPSGHNGCP